MRDGVVAANHEQRGRHVPPHRRRVRVIVDRSEVGLGATREREIRVPEQVQNVGIDRPCGPNRPEHRDVLGMEDREQPGQAALDWQVEHDVGLVEPGLRPRALDVVDLDAECGTFLRGRAGRREAGQWINPTEHRSRRTRPRARAGARGRTARRTARVRVLAGACARAVSPACGP